MTNAENVYGSRVVELVRAAAHRPIPSLVGRRTPFPDMILVPIDSKSFHHREFNAKASNVMRQGEYCKDFHNMMELSLMGYTIQPRPMVGRIDLAGLFFLKDKLAQENVFFSKLPSFPLSLTTQLLIDLIDFAFACLY